MKGGWCFHTKVFSLKMHEDWNELKILLSKIPTLTVYFFGAYERLINLLTGNVMLYMI